MVSPVPLHPNVHPAKTSPYLLQSRADRVENNIPFDKGYSHKALVRLLSQAGTEGVPDIPREGSALVPGCGRVSYHSLGPIDRSGKTDREDGLGI